MAGEDLREITIRPWDPGKDRVEEITSLLHAAYAEWKEAGQRFTATWQDDAITLDRLETATQAWVALRTPSLSSGLGKGQGMGNSEPPRPSGERGQGVRGEALGENQSFAAPEWGGAGVGESGVIVATIALYAHDPNHDVRYYRRPGLFYFGQFGVHPDLKGSGLGKRLLKTATDYALAHGGTELACDTSENAQKLIDLYTRWGFTEVDRFQWHSTNYESLVLARPLS